MKKLLIAVLLIFPLSTLNAQDFNFKKPRYVFLSTTLAPTISTMALFKESSELTQSSTGKKKREKVSLQVFIESNIFNITSDIAGGKGESLETIAEIANIGDDLKPCFYSTLKKNFDLIFPGTNTPSNHVYMMIRGYVAKSKKHCKKDVSGEM